MKKILLFSLSLVFSLPMATTAMADSCDNGSDHCGFWKQSAGVFVRDSSGDCVKSSYWSEDAVVPECGQGIADDDGDGVANADDQCPGTTPGVPVDENGCPSDSDGDGVADFADECPNTPMGVEVDARGCEVKKAMPVAAAAVEPTVVLMQRDMKVLFAFDSAKIDSDDKDDIGRIARFMTNTAPESVVFIEGHTDSVGTEEYNKKLSQKRAEAVVGTLVYQYGIAEDRVNAIGYGESRPVASNDTEAGRQANRRVTAVVKGLVEQ